MPKISIITPTKDREHFLPAIWDCVRNQTVTEVEWLIHDSSARPSATLTRLQEQESSVRYFHDPKPMTIGAKRNALCQAAAGDTIIHFDDDDYYAPGYVDGMLSLLATSNADIVKLFGFFLYHQASEAFAYWDLEHGFPLHYIMHPHHANISLDARPLGAKEAWGYGFSYVYDRKVWQARPFPDHDHGEDQVFADAAISRLRHAGMQDTGCLMVHVIHDSNTSIAYPQQILPGGVGQIYFPDFMPPPA